LFSADLWRVIGAGQEIHPSSASRIHAALLVHILHDKYAFAQAGNQLVDRAAVERPEAALSNPSSSAACPARSGVSQ